MAKPLRDWFKEWGVWRCDADYGPAGDGGSCFEEVCGGLRQV